MAVRTFLSDRGDTGTRLDLVLRRHLANLEGVTRTRMQTWIDKGTVSINGHTVRRAAARVAAGGVPAGRHPRRARPLPPPPGATRRTSPDSFRRRLSAGREQAGRRG